MNQQNDNSILNRNSNDVNYAQFSQKQWDVIFIITVCVLILVSIYSVAVNNFTPDQFLYLAKNLATGKLSVDDMPLNYPDYVIWNGHIYLPAGPFPAIILIPFLPLLEIGLYAGWISLFFSGINMWLFSKVLSIIEIDSERRKWILLLFFGGTVYFGVSTTMISWYFAHILVTTCLLLCLLMVLKTEKPIAILIGAILGLAVATRFSTLFAFPAFAWLLWKKENQGTGKIQDYLYRIQNILRLFIGLFILIIILFFYNYIRFGNIFETGYGIDVVGSKALYEARSYGLFSVFHIPRNLFILIFQGPLPHPDLLSPVFSFPYIQPSPLGMGILFTSPAVIYAFRADTKKSLVQASWLGVGFILIPLLTHYGTGWIQFGFRYSLDFMPFLVITAAYGLPKKMSNISRCLIILSVLINLWGTAWLHSWLY